MALDYESVNLREEAFLRGVQWNLYVTLEAIDELNARIRNIEVRTLEIIVSMVVQAGSFTKTDDDERLNLLIAFMSDLYEGEILTTLIAGKIYLKRLLRSSDFQNNEFSLEEIVLGDLFLGKDLFHFGGNSEYIQELSNFLRIDQERFLALTDKFSESLKNVDLTEGEIFDEYSHLISKLI